MAEDDAHTVNFSGTLSIARDDGTTATVFVQNGQQTFADYTSGTAATSPTYNYVYASYIDEPVYRDGTGGNRYFHRGQQFSITALTNSTATIKERYACTAYGTPTITDASGTIRTVTAEGNRYLFTGREYDDVTDTYHYRARIYLSRLGRFGSRDPIGYVDGENLYQGYFAASGMDPSGERKDCDAAYRFCRIINCRGKRGPEASRCQKKCFKTRMYCEKHPPMPTTLLNYGYYCGPSRSASNEACECSYDKPSPQPIDDLDRVCFEHDCCLVDELDFLNRDGRHTLCNRRFCAQLWYLDCSKSPYPRDCQRYRLRALIVTCALMDDPIPLP